MLTKVISGGQTGADRAGLIAAKTAGLETGGWMPLDYKAQDGNHPEYAQEYNIIEHPSPLYPPRTRLNANKSDGTIRIAADWNSRGEILTLKEIQRAKKPYIDVDYTNPRDPLEVATWIRALRIKTVNIAGNAERTAPGIQQFATEYLTKVFNILKQTTT
jgi:hypothetical protein